MMTLPSPLPVSVFGLAPVLAAQLSPFPECSCLPQPLDVLSVAAALALDLTLSHAALTPVAKSCYSFFK